jgi:hypothetical protein
LESPRVVAAAWISPVPRWIGFNKDWETAKAKWGFDCFHTSECLAGNPKSEFGTWPETKRVKLIRRVAQLSHQRASQGFGVCVTKKDYDEVVPAPLKEKIGRFHYTWAVRTLIGLIEQWRANRTTEPTEYIFDRMQKTGKDRDKKREIELIFDRCENQPDVLRRYGIFKGCYSFRDRCEVTPLQASDLLAWMVFQRGRYELTGKKPDSIAIEIFEAFTRSGKVYANIFTREQLQDGVSAWTTNPELYDELPYIIPEGVFPYAKTRSQNPHPAL